MSDHNYNDNWRWCDTSSWKQDSFRNVVKIESFGIKRNHAGELHKCDIPFVILILQNINVVVLPPFVYELILIFHTETYIKYFMKICHKSFSIITFSATMVGVRGHYKNTNNDNFC